MPETTPPRIVLTVHGPHVGVITKTPGVELFVRDYTSPDMEGEDDEDTYVGTFEDADGRYVVWNLTGLVEMYQPNEVLINPDWDEEKPNA